jgi:TonB family protein
MESGKSRGLVLALVLSALISVEVRAKDHSQAQDEQGKRLVQSALEKVNIWKAGTLPFRLQGSFDVFPGGSKKDAYHGTFLLTWFAPGEWRETITLPTVIQVRVVTGGKISTVRSGKGGGLEALRIETIIDMRKDWALCDDDSVRNAKNKKSDGVDSTCVDVSSNGPVVERQLCVDPAKALPVSVRRSGPYEEVVKYGDYAAWGGRQVPHSIQLYQNDKKEVDLRVESVASNGAAADSQLSVSEIGFQWESCDNPHPARMLSAPPPQYPESAKQAGKSGMVIVYLVIARDGTVQDLQVLNSPDLELGTESLRAISRWRYRPAMCGASPVLSETTEYVNYSLGP